MTDTELKVLITKALAGDVEAIAIFMALTEVRATYLKTAVGIKPAIKETAL